MTLTPTKTEPELQSDRAAEMLIKEARDATRRRRLRSLAVILVAAVLVAGVAYGFSRGGTTTGNPSKSATPENTSVSDYVVGASIPGSTLAGMHMFTKKVGLAIAPINRAAEPFVTRYLARTADGGKHWRVVGTFSKNFYPEQLAFAKPNEGYVLGEGGASFSTTEVLFTANAERTWSKVTSAKGPISLSARGDEMWLNTTGCSNRGGMSGPPCMASTLDVYRFGALSPSSVVRLPVQEPLLDQVNSADGYTFEGSQNNHSANYGLIYFTNNSGATWRSVESPCAKKINDATALSTSTLLVFCYAENINEADSILYMSANGGQSRQRREGVTPTGLSLVVSDNGTVLLAFHYNGRLYRSVDDGRTWTQASAVHRNNIDLGRGNTDSSIVTYGKSASWYAMLGRGVYRTLNGTTWKLLK